MWVLGCVCGLHACTASDLATELWTQPQYWLPEAARLHLLQTSLPLVSWCLGLGLSLYIADGKLKCAGKWVTHSQTVTQAKRNSWEPGPSAALVTGLIPRVACHLELLLPDWIRRQQPASRRPAPQCLSPIPVEVLRQKPWEQQLHFCLYPLKVFLTLHHNPSMRRRESKACF